MSSHLSKLSENLPYILDFMLRLILPYLVKNIKIVQTKGLTPFNQYEITKRSRNVVFELFFFFIKSSFQHNQQTCQYFLAHQDKIRGTYSLPLAFRC